MAYVNIAGQGSITIRLDAISTFTFSAGLTAAPGTKPLGNADDQTVRVNIQNDGYSYVAFDGGFPINPLFNPWSWAGTDTLTIDWDGTTAIFKRNGSTIGSQNCSASGLSGNAYFGIFSSVGSAGFTVTITASTWA